MSIITAFTSRSLTADRIIERYELNNAIYTTPKYKIIYLQLLINVYGAQVALAALAGLIGKPLIEATGWSTPELHEANFVKTMAAGNAALNIVTILGMNMLATKVDDFAISQNVATFAFGLPFNTVMGGLYALAGAGMQHLLTDNKEIAFAAAAGTAGNAIAYLALAIATRMGSITPSVPSITRNNFLAARTFIPVFLLGYNFPHSRYMAVSAGRNFGPSGTSETIQLFMALYVVNLMMAIVGGAVGHGIVNATGQWQDSDINTTKFVESMLAGAAIFCALTNYIMLYSSETFVSRNKISQNVATFGIGIPLYAAMGAVYGLTGSAMQGSLKNPHAIEFAATAGAFGYALAYTTSALLMDGRDALKRACTPAPIPEAEQSTLPSSELLQKNNFCLRMYKRSCCVNRSNKTSEIDTDVNSEEILRQRLMVNG